MNVCAEIDARFKRALEDAKLPPLDAPLAPVAALQVSAAIAARLTPDAAQGLAAYYGERMPRALIAQLWEPPDADAALVQGLLHGPLDPAHTPRLTAALHGLCDALTGAGLRPEDALGAPDAAALWRRRPSAAALFRSSLFGSGLPMLGAQPFEVPTLCALLRGGQEPMSVLDDRVAAHLIHELCHGRARPRALHASWMIQEAAAAHLGLHASPALLIPDRPAGALPAALHHLLLADVLARFHGLAALWSIPLGDAPLAATLGPRAAAAFDVAEWQHWRRSQRPPFAPDSLRVFDWLKLYDAARAPLPSAAGATLAALLDDASAAAPDCADPDAPDAAFCRFQAVVAGPDLLDAAAALPWDALPWYHAAPSEADEALIPLGVRALFQVHLLAPNLQLHPSPLPEDTLLLDVDACALRALPRRDGIYAEPARWLLPPPIAHRLRARGARLIRFTGCRQPSAAAIAQQIIALSRASAPLPAESTLIAADGLEA